MSNIDEIVSAIMERSEGRDRTIVAIAGPPGAGKSTIAGQIEVAFPRGAAIVVAMDGFHLDDAVLEARGLRSRKGAPETFDFAGFKALLQRIRSSEPDVAIPVFDRNIELSRAAAAIVGREARFILVEGNYLLLDEKPWTEIAPLVDISIFLDVPRAELERRLLQRWREHGKSEEAGRAWVDSNDMPNVDRVLTQRRSADFIIC